MSLITKVLTSTVIESLLPGDVLRSKGTATDLDSMVTPGVFFANYDTLNRPAESIYGIVLVLAALDIRAQIYLCLTKSRMFWRIYNHGLIAPAHWKLIG